MMQSLQSFERLAALARDHSPLQRHDPGNLVSIREAIQWMARAQDATPDRGVSHSYLIGKGWMRSYPETTGYIIPTLLNWSRISGDPGPQRRAIEMAEWESAVQLPSGAVMASVVGDTAPQPAVFNTGQVLFGWIGAYRTTRREEYLQSAVRAAGWLLDALGNGPTWSSHGSMGKASVHTFNVRTVWGVLLLAKTVGDRRSIGPMRRVLDWALSQEASPGWFAENCLNDNDQPLLHTIAYTAQGLLESGCLLGDERYVLAADRTARALARTVREDGWMAGRYDRGLRGTVRWCCLTGAAQMSIVWRRLHRLTGDQEFKQAADRVNPYLRRSQDIQSSNPGIRGGIKGSKPVNAPYGRFRVLNWATKFCVDALLFEEYPEAMDPPDYCPG